MTIKGIRPEFDLHFGLTIHSQMRRNPSLTHQKRYGNGQLFFFMFCCSFTVISVSQSNLGHAGCGKCSHYSFKISRKLASHIRGFQ